MTSSAPGVVPARQIPLVVLNALLAVWGLLAFVSGFLVRYSEDGEFGFSVKGFSYSSTTLVPAIMIGMLGLVGAFARRGPRQVYLLALAGAVFAVEIGELFTFSDDFAGETRGGGYWLLFVAVVLELLTTAAGALVQTGVVSLAINRPSAPGYPPTGLDGPRYGYPPAAQGPPTYAVPQPPRPGYGVPPQISSPYAPPPPGGGGGWQSPSG